MLREHHPHPSPQASLSQRLEQRMPPAKRTWGQTSVLLQGKHCAPQGGGSEPESGCAPGGRKEPRGLNVRSASAATDAHVISPLCVLGSSPVARLIGWDDPQDPF